MMTDSEISHVRPTVSTVMTGADRLFSDAPEMIRNKRVGVLTNHTGRLSDGRHLVDAIVESGIASLSALFGPEHGIMGSTPDGEIVDHSNHPRYKVPIYSLYGKTHKPTKEMLQNVDVLVCDIQDVGARFYTFISTIALALEAAAENNIPFLVLDRPNPIRGLRCEGPVREQSLKTFVAWMPMPVTHGLTIGELTRMWNGEGWLANGVRARLEILQMKSWKRDMWFDQTGLQWIPPSPNMQRLTTATIYPGLCFVEGTSISEGRGTSSPFELIGAPWTNSQRVLKELVDFETPGVLFSEEEFTPLEIPGTANEPKYENNLCRGIRITIANRDAIEPVKLGVEIIAAFKRAHPKETDLRQRRFDILTGSSSVRKKLDVNTHPSEICNMWKPELEIFCRLREKYFLY